MASYMNAYKIFQSLLRFPSCSRYILTVIFLKLHEILQFLNPIFSVDFQNVMDIFSHIYFSANFFGVSFIAPYLSLFSTIYFCLSFVLSVLAHVRNYLHTILHSTLAKAMDKFVKYGKLMGLKVISLKFAAQI